MSEQSSNINYSFEDIQRYINGKMSSTEMHALEKAALQDNFLADAIEGFTNADSTVASKHINEINASLHKQEKESLLFSLKRKTNWWRVAAIIILIFGIGVLSDYVFKRMNTHQDIALVKISDTDAVKRSSNVVVESDSNKPSITTNDVKETNKQAAKAKSKANPSALKKENNDDEVAMNNKDIAASNSMLPQNSEAAKSYSLSPMAASKSDSIQQLMQGRIAGVQINQTAIKGKIVDEKNEPVAFATISENGSKHATTSDVNGNFDIAVTDTNNLITASQVGYESKRIRLQPDTTNKIVLNGTNSNLNDVVVVGLGTDKAKKSKPAAPVGGWKNFNNYVVEELNKDSSLQINNLNDFVEIEFLIDDNGNPYNLKIIKPLDEKSNNKALNILSSGPKWSTTSKQKKVTVKIKF